MDAWYKKHVSFVTDTQIILDTVKVVLNGEGIFSESFVIMEEFVGTSVGVLSSWEAPY